MTFLWPFKKVVTGPPVATAPLGEGIELVIGIRPDGRVEIRTTLANVTTSVLSFDLATGRWIGSMLLYLTQHPARDVVAREGGVIVPDDGDKP